jgi:hypothetical protein
MEDIKMNKKVLLALAIFALTLVACASPMRSAEVSGAAPEFAEDEFFVEAPAAEPSFDQALPGIDFQAVENTERIVIKNANLSIIVNAPDESLQAIGRMAEEMGGFIVSANLYMTQLSDGQEVPRGSITIRVPADRLDEALTRIESESDRLPVSKNINSQDVTSDYTDLQSRLRNLEATEAQLMEIMASANKTEDVLNVFDQLTRVREQIEVIKGQIKYLDESARLSAISVELVPNEAVQPITIGGWQPVGVIKDAIQSLIIALQGLAEVIIRIALLYLPILLIIGLPLYFIIRGLLAWRRRRKSTRAK